jgi:glucose-6-phosphate-specific signal transduction histidine kinase
MATMSLVHEKRLTNPVYQAYQLLHFGFTVAPIIAGLDKYFDKLVNWDMYLAPWIAHIVGNTHAFMMFAGAVEIVAGIVVAVRPRWGGYLVALWLFGIIINLLTLSGYYDIALRDFGLFLGALALARLSEGGTAAA